jgi:mRNA-degrading endonuclease RelE of RelBE toxin-antitoxin system
MYELRFHPKVDKELGKLALEFRRIIRNEHLLAIADDPYKNGKPLKGALKGFWRRDLSHDGVSYRIAYEIHDKEDIVYILMIGKRESFYERFHRRIDI